MPDPVIVYLLLGSNSDAAANLKRAVELLREQASVVALSAVYRTAAQGETEGGSDYLNMAVKLQTELSPIGFKRRVLRSIEAQLGRKRDSAESRKVVPIDLDIALWGETPLDYGDGVKTWHSPAPDITRYAHVAVPLADLAPDFVHPENGQTLRAIAEGLRTPDIVRLGSLDL